MAVSLAGIYLLAILPWHKQHLHPQLHALQAYADAVLDEAPLLVLTDYNVTIFLRRSGDVKDNRLWASEPVWADQQSPPARAAWLNALQQAHKLRFLKPMLPRTGVRHPLEKRHTQPLHPKSHQRQAASESLVATAQIAALNDSAAPPRKRKHAEEQEADEPSFPIRVVRHHMTASGTPQQVTSPASSDDGMHCHSSLAAQLATPNATDLAAVETLLLSNLGLTDEHLLGEPYGYTYKVSLRLQPSISGCSTWCAHASFQHTLSCFHCR